MTFKNWMTYLFLQNTKEEKFRNILKIVPVFVHRMKVNGVQKKFSKYFPQKKESNTGLEQHEVNNIPLTIKNMT